MSDDNIICLVDHFQGNNGFDEFRKYIKLGNEFCKSISAIINERYDLELTYAKSLMKISSKFSRCATGCIGTVTDACISVAKGMEEEAEIHRKFALSLQEDICKPMSNLAESFYRARKPVEAAVDRTVRTMQEKRDEEARAKRRAYTAAKEAERAYEQLNELKSSQSGANSSSVSEKEEKKGEKKCKIQTDSCAKAAKEYYDSCLKAETARLDGEYVIYKSIDQLQRLDVDRLKQMFEMLKKYHKQLSDIGPAYGIISDKLHDNLLSVKVSKDLAMIAEEKGTGSVPQEQILVDLYCEDWSVEMDRTRREQEVRHYLTIIGQDIDKENKTKEGLEKLSAMYQSRPQFAEDSTQEEVRHKLNNCLSILKYLEACQYKLRQVLSNLNKEVSPPSSQNSVAPYLERTKDKMSLPQTLLRLPSTTVSSTLMSPSLANNSQIDYRSTNTYPLNNANRGGSSMYSSDEFDSDSEYSEIEPIRERLSASVSRQPVTSKSANAPKRPSSKASPAPQPTDRFNYRNSRNSSHFIGSCRALYDFKSRGNDELSIQQGDTILITKKEGDWWHGELNGVSGMFPSTYVQEI